MSNHNRFGNRWTINEVLSLQREFELLGLGIDEMAEKHRRTPNAIMFKLAHEGFADYNVLYTNYHDLNSAMPVSRTSKFDTINFLIDIGDEGDEGDEDYEDDEDDEDDEDYEENDHPLSRRVAKLETGLDEIKKMLKDITMQRHTYGSIGGSNGCSIGGSQGCYI